MQIFTQERVGSPLPQWCGVSPVSDAGTGHWSGRFYLTVCLIPWYLYFCVRTWVYEPCEYFTSLQLLCKNAQKTWSRKFYMCAPLSLQYLEILHSGTIKFTLYMCIYIVDKTKTFLKFLKF